MNDVAKKVVIEFNSITVKVEFKGLEVSQDVNESYEIILNNVKYIIKNSVSFKDSVDIPDFTNENSIMLTDYSEAQIGSVYNSVKERIQFVNKNLMEKMNLTENQNPIFLDVNISNFLKNKKDEVDIIEVADFNKKFELYKSTNLQGVTVKGLLTTIAINNGFDEQDDSIEVEKKENKYLINEIHFDGEEYEVSQQNIVVLKSEVELESFYRVDFEKDENSGLIYRVVITKK